MKVNDVLTLKLKINHKVNKICDNSKNVLNNDIFFCIKGENCDGNNYINELVNKRITITIVTDNIKKYNEYKKTKHINIVLIRNIKKKLAESLYKLNTKFIKNLKIIGVTGTNGKTTTTTLLFNYLRYKKIDVCLIGTNGVYINDDYFDGINTTPNIIVLYDYLVYCANNNINYIIMEVSSQGISNYRVHNINFNIKALTNITIDHLDYHKTFENYKKIKLDWLKRGNFSTKRLLNCDYDDFNLSKWGIIKKTFSYGQKNGYFLIKKPEITINRSNFIINIKNFDYKISSNLLAMFNIYNLSLVISILYLLNLFDYNSINCFLNMKQEIDGRMMFYQYKDRTIIIDFAHTPDGIKNILSYLNEIKQNNIISVCGCGGSRDRSKRSIMGSILSELSDITIFSTDNPRKENVSDIINEMTLFDNKKNNILRIIDRKEAIKKAIELSKENDIIAILGRGNETIQIYDNYIINECDIDIVKGLINE